MCGRFGLAKKKDYLKQRFKLNKVPDDLPLRYNICPTDNIPVILDTSADELTFVRWGLIPSWSKDGSTRSLMINARAETVCEKPSFKELVAQRRCLILADAFYEWQKSAEGSIPHRIGLKSGEVFAFAGLWDLWKGGGRQIVSCVIITVPANELVVPIHERMPAILGPQEEGRWLNQGPCGALLKSYDPSLMQSQRISSLINSSRTDTVDVIRAI